MSDHEQPDGRALIFLHELQRAVYDSLPDVLKPAVVPTRDMAPKDILATLSRTAQHLPENERDDYLRRMERAISEAKRERPLTPFEDPSWHAYLVSLASMIRESAARLYDEVPPWPVVGTLATSRVNAMTIRVPSSDEHLVVFDRGLFYYLHLFAKALALPVSVVPKGERMELPQYCAFLDSDTRATDRLWDLLQAYLLQGSPTLAEPYAPGSALGQIAGTIRQNMELFVLGHEFGHILEDHLTSGRSRPGRAGEIRITEILQDWGREIMADAHGAVLTATSALLDDEPEEHAWIGVDLFFTSLEILERAASVLTHGDVRSDVPRSHPPPPLRRKLVRIELERADSPEYRERVLPQCEFMRAAADSLWERVEARLLEAHERGARPVVQV